MQNIPVFLRFMMTNWNLGWVFLQYYKWCYEMHTLKCLQIQKVDIIISFNMSQHPENMVECNSQKCWAHGF